MKEEKPPKPKEAKKSPKPNTQKKSSRPKAEEQSVKSKADEKSNKSTAEERVAKTKIEENSPKQSKKKTKRENTNSVKATSPVEVAVTLEENTQSIGDKAQAIAPPTQEEIEDIQQEILRHGLLNPYALILYKYMRASTYEVNVQVVLTMRGCMEKIDKINQFILDDLEEEDPNQ
jgi:hypothetical protein